jgi:hypothetical protein
LNLTTNDISDLAPLTSCAELEYLSLLDGNYGITSLKPLFGLQKLNRIMMSLMTYRNIDPDDLWHYGADPDATFPDAESIIEVD